MKKVLIVEDEAIVAMENKMNLTKAGFLVVGSVSSAEDALLKIAETLPDLILMDIKLKGDLNGIDAVSIIREKNNIPVVFLTGNSDNKTQLLMKEIPNTTYLLKPVLTNDLIASVHKMIDSQPSH
jgi:DNA-binding response OmpR family regulator